MGRFSVSTLIANALEIEPRQVAARLNREFNGIEKFADAVAKVSEITENQVNVGAVALRKCLRSGMAKAHSNTRRLVSIKAGRPVAVAE